MKHPIILFVLLFFSTQLHAQREEYSWDTITFEEPYDFLQIDTTASNIWETGAPDKVLFSSAFAGSNAIFTSGDPGYPANNHSSFTLVLSPENIDHYPYSVYLEFQHKLDTEEGKDGGYIDVSYDGGASWINIIDDYFGCYSPGMSNNPYTFGLYSDQEFLYNDTAGFSGELKDWTTVRFGWEYCLTKEGKVNGDSAMVRFNFISDENDTGQEGWMIDHIRLFSLKLSGSSRDELAGAFSIYPNPAQNEVFVESNTGIPVERLQLISPTGELVGTSEDGRSIQTKNLAPGIYLVKVHTNEGTVVKKVLISH